MNPAVITDIDYQGVISNASVFYGLDEVSNNVQESGVLVDVQSINVLKETQTKRFRLTLQSDEDLQQLMQTDLDILSAGANTAQVEVTGTVDHFLKEVSRFTVENIDVSAATLEEVFM